MKATLRRLHRWVALGLGLLWLSQALTGLLMVYRWELDEPRVAGRVEPLDVVALGARIAAIEANPSGGKVTSLWATGGVDGRFDLYVDDAAGNTDVVRVDGAGNVLRVRAADEGFIPNAATLHQTLFAGDRGKTLVGLSGLLLLVSVGIGATLAWPARPGQWRQVLLPKNPRPGTARRYAWHRAAGLWLLVPATVVIGAGVLLTFEHRLEQALGLDAQPPELAAVPAPQEEPVSPARAFAAALGRFPGAALSGVAMPTRDAPWYRIRVRQHDEWRRVYGTSVVYVAASDGRILRADDALDAPAARAFLANLYPVHTGEALGPAGRMVTFAVGFWLLTLLVLGFGLWWGRRRKTT